MCWGSRVTTGCPFVPCYRTRVDTQSEFGDGSVCRRDGTVCVFGRRRDVSVGPETRTGVDIQSSSEGEEEEWNVRDGRLDRSVLGCVKFFRYSLPRVGRVGSFEFPSRGIGRVTLGGPGGPDQVLPQKWWTGRGPCLPLSYFLGCRTKV